MPGNRSLNDRSTHNSSNFVNRDSIASQGAGTLTVNNMGASVDIDDLDYQSADIVHESSQNGAKIKTMSQQRWTLEYGPNCLGKKFEEKTQLTNDEKEIYKQRVKQKMEQVEAEQHKKFDST